MNMKHAATMLMTAVLFSAGCTRISRYLYVSSYDREIKSATRAIEKATSNAERAKALSWRGRAYSEKIRYSKAFHLISPQEYERIFALAMKDHDEAVPLDPKNAQAYYMRGQTYYERAALEENGASQKWFDLAAADFKEAFAKDGKHYMALDMLGLVHLQARRWNEAIDVFSKEMELNAQGRMRLADAYCERGLTHLQSKNDAAAISDYEKSIETGADGDACSCEPYNPLVTLYQEQGQQYDKAWQVVHKANAAHKWIANETLEQLKKSSGRAQ